MRFNRAALLKAAMDAQAADRKTWDTRAATDLADYNRDLANHVAATNDLWAAAAKEIARATRTGKPVTIDMLPTIPHRWDSREQYPRVWTRKPPTPGEYTPHPTTAKLIAVLRATTDDYVTSNGLSTLGIGRETISAVAYYMTSNTLTFVERKS